MNHRYTRAVRKVSCHFQYLENRPHVLDVTWQQVRRDVTAHPRTLSRGASQSAVRRRWLRLCTVTFAFTMTERADQFHHDNTPIHSTALVQAFFGHASHNPALSATLTAQIWLPAVESAEICESDGHTIHKFNHRRLTADWLVPRDSYCSRMHSKVSSDWLPSYNKATQPVLEIFKMAGYFLDSPRI
jgi:hypothetical protein